MTHTAQQLQGKAIISVTNGRRVGSVVDVYVDPDSLAVSAVVTSKGSLLRREIKAVPASQVTVWGEDVLLVSGPDVVAHEDDLAGLGGWVSVADQLRGRYVVSTEGVRVGQVNDVMLDSGGHITAYELARVFVQGTLADSRRIPVELTHSLGQDVLIITMPEEPAAAEPVSPETAATDEPAPVEMVLPDEPAPLAADAAHEDVRA